MSARQARSLLQDELEMLLERSGYTFVKLSSGSKACFDIIAKKNDLSMIIKVEPYIDSFNKENSYELKNLASFLNASPVIVGMRGRRFDEIDDGVVLLRYGIPVVSPETFMNLVIYGVPPIIYCNRGGYFVQINRNILRKARVDKNLSYSDLTRLIYNRSLELNEEESEVSIPPVRLSKRTVYEYEHSINPPPEVAAYLEEILNVSLTQGINIFDMEIEKTTPHNFELKPNTPLHEEIADSLKELGLLSQFWTKMTPFDVFGAHLTNEKPSGLNVLICVEGKEKDIVSRATLTKQIASITKRRPIVVVKENNAQLSQQIPTFTLEELKKMERTFELVREWVKKHAGLKEKRK